MYSKELQLFDEFYVKEYRYLKSFCKSIDPRADYESLLHDSYIRCKNRIDINGYSGETFLNYVRCTIMNLQKTQYRQQKNIQKVSIDDECYYNNIENTLLEKELQEQQEQEINNRNVFLTTLTYEYVEKYFNQKEVFIFKTYYLLRNKHLNYKELSKTTGYSQTTVSNIIKRVKKDLRENLKAYIYTGKKLIELSQKEREDYGKMGRY